MPPKPCYQHRHPPQLPHWSMIDGRWKCEGKRRINYHARGRDAVPYNIYKKYSKRQFLLINTAFLQSPVVSIPGKTQSATEMRCIRVCPSSLSNSPRHLSTIPICSLLFSLAFFNFMCIFIEFYMRTPGTQNEPKNK